MAETGRIVEELNHWKAEWKKDAERLLMDVYPAKVLQIDKLLCSSLFAVSRTDEIRSVFTLPPLDQVFAASQLNCVTDDTGSGDSVADSTSTKQFKGEDSLVAVNYGPVECNAKVMELITMIKPVVQEIVDNVNKVKMWITFLIPKVEDGNNFGVQIQEEALGEARAVEVESAGFMDVISRYLLSRGRMVCKCVKYPHVVDFQEAVRDLDEKAFLKMRQMLIGIRNHYGCLHDMITKNIKKIKTPRSRNVEHLY